MEIDCKPLAELRRQLMVISKVTKNSRTVIFKCINIVDGQKFDVTVVKVCRRINISNYSLLEHKHIVPGTFYETPNNVVVQVSKGAIFDLETAIRKNRIYFNEITVRKLLQHILIALQYCEKAITKPFKITSFDILVYKEVNSTNPTKWVFKLKNCFIENQFDDLGISYPAPSKGLSSNTSFLTDEYIISAIVKLGSIVFDATNNRFGYLFPLEIISSKEYSESLRYVINSMIHYRVLKSPPKIRDLLLFFQTPRELYSEKLRSALFEGAKIKKKLLNYVYGCINRSKSCFF
jgi:hypothetical protein